MGISFFFIYDLESRDNGCVRGMGGLVLFFPPRRWAAVWTGGKHWTRRRWRSIIIIIIIPSEVGNGHVYILDNIENVRM